MNAPTAPRHVVTWDHFWRHWNPVFRRPLKRFVYRPARRVLPHPAAVILTFAASGFLFHDLLLLIATGGEYARTLRFPFATVWFALVGVIVVVGAVCRVGIRTRHPVARALFHAIPLLAGLAGALVLFVAVRR